MDDLEQPAHDASQEATAASRFVVRPTAEAHFAWIRTRLALERTLMSYSRTAIALIGFGFTMFQFLDKVDLTKVVTSPRSANVPQVLCLLLIAAGILFLAIGTWDYFLAVAYMHEGAFDPIAGVGAKRWHSGTLIAVALLFIVGVFAFVAVYFQI